MSSLAIRSAPADHIFLCTRNMNAMYGFLGEIKHKYDDTVMRSFTRLFQCLPLAAVIHDKVSVVMKPSYVLGVVSQHVLK